MIDIREGPICWVNLKKRETRPQYGQPSVTWYSEYGIPDPQVMTGVPEVSLKTARIKHFPLFGEVVDLRWTGKDFNSGLIDRLTSDFSLKRAIMDSYDLEIDAKPSHSCWILTARELDAHGGNYGTAIWP